MSKQREALEIALQALEEIATHYPADWEFDLCVYAKTLIIEALAEPEQEPVAVVTSQTGDPTITMSWHHEPALPIGIKLYTTPPARKPLTDAEIEDCLPMGTAEYTTVCGKSEIRKFARAIERAHGITE